MIEHGINLRNNFGADAKGVEMIWDAGLLKDASVCYKAVTQAYYPPTLNSADCRTTRTSLNISKSSQNGGPPADLATSHRPLALRLLWKTPLMPSRAATAEHDGVMHRVDVASPFPNSLL